MTKGLAKIRQEFEELKDNVDLVYNYDDANLVLESYALAEPKPTLPVLNNFIPTFCHLAVKSNQISFSSLETMLAKRNFAMLNDDIELFDEVKPSEFKIDKKALNNFITTLGKTTQYSQNISQHFSKNIHRLITEKLQRYSFSDEDIKQIQQSLGFYYQNTKIRENYQAISSDINDIFNNKKNRDIKRVNNWAFGYKKDSLLQKLSFRSTYINLVYEAIVRQHDIKDINIDNYYKKHISKTREKISSLIGTSDKNGKTFCPQYAINKVYKAIALQDSFKLGAIEHSLKKHQDSDFYQDTVSILKSIEGGRKNREINLPKKNNNYSL